MSGISIHVFKLMSIRYNDKSLYFDITTICKIEVCPFHKYWIPRLTKSIKRNSLFLLEFKLCWWLLLSSWLFIMPFIWLYRISQTNSDDLSSALDPSLQFFFSLFRWFPLWKTKQHMKSSFNDNYLSNTQGCLHLIIYSKDPNNHTRIYSVSYLTSSGLHLFIRVLLCVERL